MSRGPATKPPRILVAIVLFLGSASVALGASLTLPGLRDFDWAHDARAGRELIDSFAQVSGPGSDILPVGILFVLPVFAARWLLPRPGERSDPERAWEERQRKPSIRRALLHLAKELALVVAISALLGVVLASYLAAFVLPSHALSPSFVPSAAAAVAGASVVYFVMIRGIDSLNLVDGAAALTFCGAAVTLVAALAAVSPVKPPLVGEMNPTLARALLTSTVAVPVVIALLKAHRTFAVTSATASAHKRMTTATMPFRLVPENSLPLAIGMLLWTVTSAMIAAAVLGHMDLEVSRAFDWVLFPAQPILFAVLFYWLVTGRLAIETRIIATSLRRYGSYLPGARPGTQTEEILDFAFRRMLATGAVLAGALSALVATLFWISGATPLQSLQGLAWIWTIGASGAVLLRGIDARTERTAFASSLLPRFRWSPARIQFTLMSITALIDRKLAPEEKYEALALGKRLRSLHEIDKNALHNWLAEVETRKHDQEALIHLATVAIADFPADVGMRRALYAQCADIAHADRTVNVRERRFLGFLADGLNLASGDRTLIDAVLNMKNRH